MEVQDALMILKQSAPTATEGDARAFLAICAERGLSPFVEASPILTDYNKRNGDHVHSLSVKEHYTVQERWAQQCGGYTISRTEVVPHEGGLRARIWLISNRDYAAVGKLAATIPNFNFHEELKRFEVLGEALVSEREFKRRAAATKTWDWIARKRAREGALRQKFGKEPSQSRQMYANALTQSVRDDAIAQLYPVKTPYALPVNTRPPAVETAVTEIDYGSPVGTKAVTVEAEITEPEPMTLDQAATYTTPKGTEYGKLDFGQLVEVIEAYSKMAATGELDDDQAMKLGAAQLLRDDLKALMELPEDQSPF